jgi:hypothetical protein
MPPAESTKTRAGISGSCLLALLVGVVWYFLHHSEGATFQKHTMHQWLKVLRVDSGPDENALRIVRITDSPDSGALNVEVALSYDLLIKNDFFGRNGKLDLNVNGLGYSPVKKRGANGDCLLEVERSMLNSGTNDIRLVFLIFNPADRDRPLYAEGPARQVVVNQTISHHGPSL